MIKLKMHFREIGCPQFETRYGICGFAQGPSYVTSDPSKVTCGHCKKRKEFKEALAKGKKSQPALTPVQTASEINESDNVVDELGNLLSYTSSLSEINADNQAKAELFVQDNDDGCYYRITVTRVYPKITF